MATVSLAGARRLTIVTLAWVCAVGASAGPRPAGAASPAAGSCPAAGPASAYTKRVLDVLGAGTDVWGDRLLALPGGPSHVAARRYLKPLMFARGAQGRSLTASGVYYLPFAQPDGARGAGSVALHVADGSQIVSQHVGGAALTVLVGSSGRERFGSCLARLATPALAGGYLPILETRYVDSTGARYTQESFAARVAWTRSLVSFVQVSVDTRRAKSAVRLRLSSSGPGSKATVVPRGTTRTVYAAWVDDVRARPLRIVAARFYADARRSVVSYWAERLADGASISVPEPQVENAVRALLVQELELTWRYSIGNPYEEFSFPESVDVAETLAEHGFQAVARSILRTSLTRSPTPYPNWKKGDRLLASAEYYRLFADRAYIDQVTPVLRGYVAALGRQIGSGDGLLHEERYSSDIPAAVYGLHSQAVVWAGLRAMADVWANAAEPALAATCHRLAGRLGTALRRAVRASERRLSDGSLFIPVALRGGERPYASVTEQRLGSYWNLVMPYALASGFFPPGSREATGVLRYMLLHGSRLLGLVRAGGYALYGRNAAPPVSGTDQVYGNAVARFLADNDQADQLVLSMYGHLAAGMTAGTFVSGEAATVAPLNGESYRSMYLPPNGASNAAFLETLRLMIVHETADARGRPRGLQLAYATPRAWLRPGRRIAVAGVPTSFGPLQYSIAAGNGVVHATVAVPDREQPKTLTLRLRLPANERIAGVTAGGRPFRRFDPRTGTIDLSGLSGTIELSAGVARAGGSP